MNQSDVRQRIEIIMKENGYPEYKPSYTQPNKRQVQGYLVLMTSYKRLDATLIKLNGSQHTKKYKSIKETTFDDFKCKLIEVFGESNFVIGHEEFTVIH